ncbi:MAG: T9SS type A sorting domain-containing protein [Candidatus Kapaibacterium sp.]
MRIYTAILFAILFGAINLFGSDWSAVACGGEFTMAIKNDGSLWGWGFNGNGQLGIASSETVFDEPVRVGEDNDWAQIDCGGFHVLAIKNDGTLWAWGLNGNRQVGSGIPDMSIPEPVLVSTDKWTSISAGMISSFAIRQDGTLWAWGNNTYQVLGVGGSETIDHPTQIGNDSDWERVAASGFHVIAMKTEGTIWGWGYNLTGQTGTGSEDEVVTAPTQIGGAGDWTDIKTGYEFSIGHKRDGTLWAWGFNGNSQLGVEINDTQANAPVKINEDTDWVEVEAGSAYTLAIKDDGTLWGWGFNGNGQLGNGTMANYETPEKVSDESDWTSIAAAEGIVVQSSVFGFHTIGLRSDENGYCAAGANYVGQLGNGALENETSFTCGLGTAVDEEIISQSDINIYPNPAQDALTVRADVIIPGTIAIFDASGRMITARPALFAGGKETLDVSDLPAGAYFMVVKSAGEERSIPFTIAR